MSRSAALSVRALHSSRFPHYHLSRPATGGRSLSFPLLLTGLLLPPLPLLGSGGADYTILSALCAARAVPHTSTRHCLCDHLSRAAQALRSLEPHTGNCHPLAGAFCITIASSLGTACDSFLCGCKSHHKVSVSGIGPFSRVHVKMLSIGATFICILNVHKK